MMRPTLARHRVCRLAGRRAAVKQAAVIGIPDPLWGEAMHAVVLLEADSGCPRKVEFQDALPLSQASKILQSELRRPFREDRARAVD